MNVMMTKVPCSRACIRVGALQNLFRQKCSVAESLHRRPLPWYVAQLNVGPGSDRPFAAPRISLCRSRREKYRFSATNQGEAREEEKRNGDSDVVLLAKLIFVSIASGALIKYGSLLIDLPFQANITVALAAVFIPPAFFVLWILQQQHSR